jgi:integrase
VPASVVGISLLTGEVPNHLAESSFRLLGENLRRGYRETSARAGKQFVRQVSLKCGVRWGVIEIGKNPVALVRVKNASKRLKRPQILEVAQFFEMLKHLAEPYRTMVMVAQCTGLRISEILGLQWGDFDFEAHTFMVQRSVVSGRVDAVKTEYSKDYVPLDPRLEGLLLEWRTFSAYSSDADWVFANPQTGKPFHQESLKKHQLHRVAELIGLPDGIGWHTFRHTYRSWLDETGAPMKVQQELMRHASIQTTMNIYGRAMNDSKRKANSQVVGLAFGETLHDRKGDLNTTVLQ